MICCLKSSNDLLFLETLQYIQHDTQLKDNSGANLVEYIILVGVIALVAIVGSKIFGEKVDSKIQEQSNKVEQIGN